MPVITDTSNPFMTKVEEKEVSWAVSPNETLNLPLIPKGSGAAFSYYMITRVGLVPSTYDPQTGFIDYVDVGAESDNRQCLDLLFKFEEGLPYTEIASTVTPVVSEVMERVQKIGGGYHLGEVWIKDKHLVAPISETNQVRWLVIRVWANTMFECIEHPELLVGQPIGQHHCPECGEMQMAGMMHMPKD